MSDSWQVAATVHAPGPSEGDPAPYSGPDSFTFVRLRLRDPGGVEGNGFTGRFLAPEVAHFLNRAVSEVLKSGTIDPIAALAAKYNPRRMGGVVVSALSALDIALTDIAAQRAGQSVAELLGGKRSAAPVHVTCGFPELEEHALADTCAREVASGAAGVKVLIAAKGRSVQEDLTRLYAVRRAIGPTADLIADANCKMELDTALRFVEGAQDLNLTWLEEPVIANDTAALARLAKEGIPLGAGQMEQSAERFEALQDAGVSVIQPNAVFLGGFQAAIKVARKAAANGASISMAGGWDVLNLHWICGALDHGAVELHRAQARIARLFMADLTVVSDGMIAAPDVVGLGLIPDEVGLKSCLCD